LYVASPNWVHSTLSSNTIYLSSSLCSWHIEIQPCHQVLTLNSLCKSIVDLFQFTNRNPKKQVSKELANCN
jgi:hypothetical protein